jgi:acyl-CoA synthetase (AMP-forming)/AMP-acid ligase II
MAEASLPVLVQQLANRVPDETAYTFVDYDLEPSGFAESLTWAQVHRGSLIIADELRMHGSTGDRAAIVAPQGLDYIVAFLGALQAGFIAVPLPAPEFGLHDDRVSSALQDSAPSVVLTTSSIVSDVAKHMSAAPGERAPVVVEIDSLNFDVPRDVNSARYPQPNVAYLQYTSGSTRQPAGVEISHQNVVANLRQLLCGYFRDYENVPPPLDATVVSWLPFYHDMGLVLAICAPVMAQRRAVLMSPVSFLQRPSRWMRLLASNPNTFSAAPNFAFELAARRTSDDDLAGLDLGNVLAIINGSEHIHTGTIARFNERFARFGLSEAAMRPSYGLAEATVYVASAKPGGPPKIVRFNYPDLSNGQAKPCGTDTESGTDLIGHGTPDQVDVRIVNPDTGTENPAGAIGEIWVHGPNVAARYWRNPELTQRTFGARLQDPTPGTAEGPWLRTGDLGFICEGELFIAGRMKDLLIVDGRNHYPDDIEATIREITGGRVAAISVPDQPTERLVAIVELKNRGRADSTDVPDLRLLKREVASAVSRTHSLRVADLVLVSPGSIPITTSGKVRRAACVESYRSDGFNRLDMAI